MITFSFLWRKPLEQNFYFCWRRRIDYGRRLTWLQFWRFEVRAW